MGGMFSSLGQNSNEETNSDEDDPNEIFDSDDEISNGGDIPEESESADSLQTDSQESGEHHHPTDQWNDDLVPEDSNTNNHCSNMDPMESGSPLQLDGLTERVLTDEPNHVDVNLDDPSSGLTPTDESIELGNLDQTDQCNNVGPMESGSPLQLHDLDLTDPVLTDEPSQSDANLDDPSSGLTPTVESDELENLDQTDHGSNDKPNQSTGNNWNDPSSSSTQTVESDEEKPVALDPSRGLPSTIESDEPPVALDLVDKGYEVQSDNMDLDDSTNDQPNLSGDGVSDDLEGRITPSDGSVGQPEPLDLADRDLVEVLEESAELDSEIRNNLTDESNSNVATGELFPAATNSTDQTDVAKDGGKRVADDDDDEVGCFGLQKSPKRVRFADYLDVDDIP